MQIRPEQLAAHLARACAACTWCTATRPCCAGGGRPGPRRRARCRLQRAPGAHRRRRALRLERPRRRGAVDEPVRRTPADRDPHPVGQAGQGRFRGAAGYAAGLGVGRRGHAGDAAAPGPPPDRQRLVRRARRRRHQRARGDRRAQRAAAVDRAAPRGPGPARRGGDEGRKALAFFADQVEGNLLAAQQEIAKLGLLHGAGELSFEQIEAAVLNVARYDVSSSARRSLAGRLRARCACSTACRPRARRRCSCTTRSPATSSPSRRVRDALDAAGRCRWPCAREPGWGAKERLFERVLPLVGRRALDELVEAASTCDGLCKGGQAPDWPDDPWVGLQRLALMVCETRRAGADEATRAGGLRLALVP